MTILQIITRLILGGAQTYVVSLCQAQVNSGHRVVLAYGPIYGPEGSLYDAAKATGAELVEVPAMRRAILPTHDLACYRQLRALIRRVGPDVVQTHSSKAGIVGRAAAWAERVPAVVHTIHGLPYHERQPAPVRRLYIELERWAARRCHRLVGVTQAMCDEFLARGIGRADQFAVVPNGFDLASYETPPGTRARVRAELGIAPAAPVIGIVARLDPLKGQDDLVDVLPRLAASFADVRLLLVGDGWHRTALERRIASKGLGDRVVFTGLVPPDRVPGLLRAMDIMALPSYQEGQGRTLIEALLCGCAIAGYDAGGIGEVCIDGRTGRLVPVGDRNALAEALAWMLAHPQERSRLAEGGRAMVTERYDQRRVVARMEEVYRQVLHAPPGGG